mmetsp:Transcript_12858/g.22200  ORF Transcript_12858/g.22200 Transcript_12858/m.22200 type:complete len:86 (+) Transcript_12858:138-395(+)|eukprot:CAMPEP_0196665800 /NCGR_PEP_ID=MMETSP1086-20130531/62621_1 /TAXON_ID=77921 /ORGANISM="Cyanoptyche  gloeocystis , Strain SAG4.97" /LENGTH=85 /DNA_ID=CAMNT_0042002735 /DNA_START=137 /DNA_END=394 /DNA_ORIENTATION=+
MSDPKELRDVPRDLCGESYFNGGYQEMQASLPENVLEMGQLYKGAAELSWAEKHSFQARKVGTTAGTKEDRHPSESDVARGAGGK